MTPEKFEYWRKYGEEVIGFRWGPGVCCLKFAHLGVFLMLPVSLQLWKADALQNVLWERSTDQRARTLAAACGLGLEGLMGICIETCTSCRLAHLILTSDVLTPVFLACRYVASGPLVRSSYRAGEFFIEAMIKDDAAAAKN